MNDNKCLAKCLRDAYIELYNDCVKHNPKDPEGVERCMHIGWPSKQRECFRKCNKDHIDTDTIAELLQSWIFIEGMANNLNEYLQC